jgi:hypothetical protein
MSVTISIRGNHTWARRNNQVVVEEYDGEAFETFPFEMNVANRNFRTLWSSLGFNAEDEDLCGQMDGRVILQALRTADPALIERETERGGGDTRAAWIDFGIRRDQASMYLVELFAIANEATRREEPVTWG